MSLGRTLGLTVAFAAMAGWPVAVAQTDRPVEITDVQADRLGIATAPLREVAHPALTELPALVIPSRDGSRPIVAPFAGVLDRVFALEGSDVRVGEPIASVISRDYQSNRSGLEQAQAETSLARAAATRQRLLHEEGLISKAALEEAEARLRTSEAVLAEHGRFAPGAIHPTEERSGAYLLRAPASGRVTAVTAHVGDPVDAMSKIATIATEGTLRVEIQVPARLVGLIAPGDVVEFGPEVLGEVQSAGSALNPATRATVAIASVPEGSGARLGDLLRVRILAGTGADAVLEAPASSVIPVDGQTMVFVAGDTGFNAVPVRVFGRTSDTVTLAGEVQAGESVAMRGLTELKAMLLAGRE